MGIESDQQIGILILRKFFQQIFEPYGIDFCRSSTGLGQTQQCWFLKQFHGSV